MLLSGRSNDRLYSTIESNMDKLRDSQFRQLVHGAFAGTISGHNYRGYGILFDQNEGCGPNFKVHTSEVSLNPRPLWFVFTEMGFNTQAPVEYLMDSCGPFASSLHNSNRILKESLSVDLLEIFQSNSRVIATSAKNAASTALQV